jgi:hypothetical protein
LGAGAGNNDFDNGVVSGVGNGERMKQRHRYPCNYLYTKYFDNIHEGVPVLFL